MEKEDIRAKKISQLPDLDISDWENLYFVLGYNADGQVANYKCNILQLAQTLVDTGLISTTSNVHNVSYERLVNITTTSSSQFEGKAYSINLVPNKGFRLPETITVEGAEIISYDRESGLLRIDAGNKEGVIYVGGTGEYIEYDLQIDLIGMTYVNDNVKETYHVNDEIILTLSTIDQDHYDVPDEFTLTGLEIVGTDGYKKDLGYTGTLKLRFNGTVDANVSGSAKRIYLYYFGYSIYNDHILEYDENNIPIAPGTRFNTLIKGRNVCPVNYVNGFDYGNGLDEVPGEESINQNIYIIIPQKYFINGNDIFKNDTGEGFKMTAGNSSFERQIQYTESANPEKMIYTFKYEEIDYYAFCISTEGIIGHQMFKSLGSVAELLVNIRWETQLPVKIAAGTSANIPAGIIKLIYGDDHEETMENGFTISYNDSLGTFDGHTYTAPSIAGLQEERNVIKFTCNYLTFSDTKSTIVYIPGEDDDLEAIAYRDNIQDIDFNESFILDKRKVYGIKENGEEISPFSLLNRIRFECEFGDITNNGDDTFTYTAPMRQMDALETLNIIYKESYVCTIRFTIFSPDFHDIIWPTVLPKGIYDTERLKFDTTVYKVMDNGSYQKLTDPNFSITASKGTIDANSWTYIPPSNIHQVEETTYIKVADGTTLIAGSKYYTTSGGGGEFTAEGTEVADYTHNYWKKHVEMVDVPDVNSYIFVDFTLTYKHCHASKRIYVHHGSTPTLTDYYWYCGQYCPTGTTNPVNDLANTAEILTDPGWRKIDQSLPHYRNPESVFNGTVTFYQGYTAAAEYYVVVPYELVIFNNSGVALVDPSSPTNTIQINGHLYNIYKRTPKASFADKLYYVQEAAIYWYVGKTYPLDPLEHSELITPMYASDTPGYGGQYELNSGWHVITNYQYLKNNHQPIYSNASIAFDEPGYYLALPADAIVLNGLDEDQTRNYQVAGSMSIDGVGYTVYNTAEAEFSHLIYP